MARSRTASDSAARPSAARTARELVVLVETMVGASAAPVAPAGSRLYAELENLARVIDRARAEIAALRPDEIRERHLPSATDALDAVPNATEEATHGILRAVQRIDGLTAEMTPEVASAVNAAVAEVHEACNFQDVSGQRIKKVVRTLQHVETTVGRLLAAFGAELAAPSDAESGQFPATTTGTRPAQDAKRQAEIDARFGPLD